MLSESVSVTRNKTTRKQDKLKSGLFTSGSSPTSLQTHYSHDKDVISESKCADNTNFRFISYDQTHRSCSWITTSNNNNNMSQVEQEEQFHRWCDAKSTFNNTEIISNCQMSCGLCTTKPISSFCTSHDFKFKSPNPLPYRITYNDGTITPNIFVRRKFYSSNRFDKCIITYEETEDQFTIFPRTPHVDELFYAEIDDETGNFLDTGLVVGRDDPKIVPIRKGTKFGQILQKNVIERMVEIKEQEEKIKYPYQQSSEMIKHGRETWTNNNQYASGKIQNLVILMKFNDHPADNNLPRKEDYEKIFNGDCGHEDPLCPTGSFNDVFHQNSFYDEQSQTGLSVISVVLDWVTIGFSEEECGKDSTGGRDFGIEICIKDALQRVEERDEWLNFSEFENSLGTTFISFIHSGYDQSFAIDMKKRIWSHKGVFSSPWKSRGKPAQGIPSVTVDNYHISSGLYGSAGGNIARVGVLAHEFSHFLGLPDLYDFVGSVGAGVGNYDLMANSWGWSGTQLNPPLMSAWSKKELGWINPQVIDVEEMPRTFTLRQSCDASDAIMVTANFPAGEYIIIENRQPCGFDKELPQGGLAIWHIDDKKLNEAAGMYDQGEPSQVEWPQNGNHYRVALLQADGRYDLENDVNWGDSDDLFRGGRGGVSSIGPDGLSNGNSYPNTNAYQDGIIMNTGLAIYDISPVGEYMTLTISFGNLITPTKTPTSNKHSDSNDDNFQADNGDSLQDEHLSKEKKINCDLPKDALVKEVMFNFIAYGELTIEDINHKLCDISGSRKILAFELSYLRKKHQGTFDGGLFLFDRFISIQSIFLILTNRSTHHLKLARDTAFTNRTEKFSLVVAWKSRSMKRLNRFYQRYH